VTTDADRARPASAAPRALRVAFLVDGFRIGGTELNAVRTAEALDRNRAALTVLGMSREGPLLGRYEAAGIPVVDFWFRGLRHPDVLPMTGRLARWLRAARIDVLHCHDRYSNIFGALGGRLARVPLVITSRRFQDYGERRLAIANRMAYHLSHRVLANSAGVGEMLVAEGVPAHKVAVVPNFLDDSAFDLAPQAETALRRELGIDAATLLVGCVARLSRIKGHDTLLRAFAALAAERPAVLVLLGDGEERAALEALAASLGVADRVRFTGMRSNAVNLHQGLDVSVLASYAEGFPNAVIEAMAVGVPVVATAVGGVRDAVADGETGYVVPPRDVDALAAALRRLADDAEKRRRYGREGRRRAMQHYRRTEVLETIYALWQSGRRAQRPAAG
jgi:glycosyltransferase involved in cell wall biosynthesis